MVANYAEIDRVGKPEVVVQEVALVKKFWHFYNIFIKHKTIIMKTCLYNFDLVKPHFYIVKLGFTGVYIIFLISAQKHRLWNSLEPPRRGGSNEYPNLCFEQKYDQNQIFFIWKFSFFGGKIFNIFE